MASRGTYTVFIVPGLYPSTKRSLTFLECAEESDIDAKSFYDAMQDKERRMIQGRFDHWLQGFYWDKYFHGWSEPACNRGAFVFKWNRRKQHRRFYGFLTKPRTRSDPSFQVCTLVSYAQKNTFETDPSEMNFVNDLRARTEVIDAIKLVFPD